MRQDVVSLREVHPKLLCEGDKPGLKINRTPYQQTLAKHSCGDYTSALPFRASKARKSWHYPSTVIRAECTNENHLVININPVKVILLHKRSEFICDRNWVGSGCCRHICGAKGRYDDFDACSSVLGLDRSSLISR